MILSFRPTVWLLCFSILSSPAALAQSVARPTLMTFEQIEARMPAITELNLTSAQQTQLLQIMNQAQADLEAVMTDEQKQLFWSALNQGATVRDAVMEANLSLWQLRQLRPVMQSTQTDLEAVLTPEQQQQVDQIRQTNP